MLTRHRFPMFAAALLIWASSVFAAKVPPDGAIAPIEITQSSIRWRVQVPSTSATLTISRPDGEVWSREYRSPNVTLSLQDLGSPEDGTYTYELTITPPVSAQVKEHLEKARKNNDDAAARKALREAGLDRPFVESGAFSILTGSFVVPRTEGQGSGVRASAVTAGGDSGTIPVASGRTLRPVPNDQVIPDDMIVQGSLCVGLDCVNNENFGFDTIRLKENNTRIAFDDTSTQAGFPFNDWEIQANDSPSGSASKFSILDITGARTPLTLRAGAPTNSIFIDSTGRLGLRTATPVLDLHITTGNTPGWRLEQTSTSGFTAQTWDVAGNEANFFIRDVTNGSRLPFRIRPGAPTSSIDIAPSGNVRIGFASSTSHSLDVNVDDTLGLRAWTTVSGTSSQPGIELRPGPAGLNQILSMDRPLGLFVPLIIQAGPQGIHLSTNGNIGIGGVTGAVHPIQHSSGAHLTATGSWINASSREYKENIAELEAGEAMEALRELNPVTFSFKVEPEGQHVGFIAEEVPDLVATEDRRGLSPMDIVAVLTKVVQEQQKTIDELSGRLKKLEADTK